MDIKKATIGRPTKINMRVIEQLADAIAHNTNITDSCDYVGISRQSYYHHLNTNKLFAKTMTTAKNNRTKVLFTFLTIP